MQKRRDQEADRVRDAYRRRTGLTDRYSVFDRAHLCLIQARERAVLSLLAEEGMADLRDLSILEVGAGTGQWLLDLIRWGATPGRLTGVDLNAERADIARSRLPEAVRYCAADGRDLPFPDGSQDLIVMATVFSSVLDQQMRRALAAEAMRVLAPGGALLFYDFALNNRRNPDVRKVTRAELAELFPGTRRRLRSTTLAPPLGRRIAPVSATLYQLFELLPFLRTHVLGVIRKEGRA